MRGNLVYAYGAMRALAAGGRRRSGHARRRAARTSDRLQGRGRQPKAYGGGMLLAPDAALDDGLLDVVIVGHDAQAAVSCGCCPKVFKGTHVHEPERRRCSSARRGRRSRADRPFTMYADGDPIAELPVTVRALPGAVSVIAPPMSLLATRRSSPPAPSAGSAARAGRRRHEPAREGADRGSSPARSPSSRQRLPRGSVGHLGDQRQDDDRRDGGLDPRARRDRPRAQSRRREHGRRRRLGAAGRRPRRRRDRRRARAVRGRRVLARPDRARALDPARVLLGNLFRDQLDRYGELETIADRWAAAVVALPGRGRRSS